MKRATAKIADGGRIVIPADYRKALGLRTGDAVMIRLEEGEIRIRSIDEGIRRAQALGGWVTGPPDRVRMQGAGRSSPRSAAARDGSRRSELCRRGRRMQATIRRRPDRDQVAAAGAGRAAGSGQTRSSLPRLWAKQAGRYSPVARAKPRRLRLSKPRACLSWPKTGSTIALRRA